MPPETVIQLLDELQVTVHTAYTGYECVCPAVCGTYIDLL